ncbi:MAG: CoA transferase, partial [Chloroflexota bacterium]
GVGEVVSTSLLQGMLWFQQLHIGAIKNTGEQLRPFDPANAANAFLNLYKCGDGEWLAMGMTAMSKDDWFAFCDVIERPDLKHDQRFERGRERIEHAKELIGVIGEAMLGHRRAEWVSRIEKIGIPVAPVRRLAELLEDADVQQEGFLTQTTAGMQFVRPPFNIEGVPAHADDAPDFARDTFAVLSEAGFTVEEIAALQQAGVVW